MADMRKPAVAILDGPLGTRLLARGVATPAPIWSAHALRVAPEVVAAIHREYARAGARVLTANTFRAQPGVCPEDWDRLAQLAARLAREAADEVGARVAGSIAPIHDCYRPDLSPGGAPEAQAAHAALADALAEAGVDILLCETFPHADEAVCAVTAAVATGVETWLALTAGPEASLMTPAAMADAARSAVGAGARAALVNCVAAAKTLPYVEALAEAALGVPVGAYANAGAPEERMGWRNPEADPDAPRRYADLASAWIDAGATLVGGCCGTGPAHIAELARRFSPPAQKQGG